MISIQTCTLIIFFMMLIWTLKNLPFINLDAAFNLQRNLMNLIKRMQDFMQELEDEANELEREKHRKDKH
jgi:hypothetical protein